MAAPATTEKKSTAAGSSPGHLHEPYVPDDVEMHEFTWPAVLVGVILGIIFGASSLYLVLKVGLTVSASIPVAVLSITMFRGLSRAFNLRQATILENNIVQTTGSAGESIAFGVGVTIPALLLIGHDMSVVRVMTVGVLGGLLGILMMIPLRRAFIVQQHGKLRYPEGTACADVLIVGEEGGASAKTVFAGFGLAFLYKFAMKGMGLWRDTVEFPLYTSKGRGLLGGVLSGELTPELLGVGYIIGPRIAGIMMAGGVLAYLVLVPLIIMFGVESPVPIMPEANSLIRDMNVKQLRDSYILYIGAGAVATGGIISMIQALPMILHSLRGAMGDLAGTSGASSKGGSKMPRTERDLPMWVMAFGSLGLVVALAATPALGLGFSINGLVGAGLIVLFGFLFVTVSSRLTGEIGSSSNPISGMTVATLLLTCLVFLMMGYTDKAAKLTALTIAAVVCIASSNAGTTSQDLKTGYLVGGTPRSQQIAILVGALTSALVIGLTLILLNNAGTVYTRNPQYLPRVHVDHVQELTQMEQPGGQYAETDTKHYHVLHVGKGEMEGVPAGKYLVNDNGQIVYFVDPAINGMLDERDDGEKVANKFEAPKTLLMGLIIDGILSRKLPWELVLVGALIAVVLELAGVPSLPFAVGVYLPISISTPIFIGGLVRFAIDKLRGIRSDDSDMSPGVLLSSGYIAGGAIAGVLIAFLTFAPRIQKSLNMTGYLNADWLASRVPALVAFGVLMFVLAMAGLGIMFRSAKQTQRGRGK